MRGVLLRLARGSVLEEGKCRSVFLGRVCGGRRGLTSWEVDGKESWEDIKGRKESISKQRLNETLWTTIARRIELPQILLSHSQPRDSGYVMAQLEFCRYYADRFPTLVFFSLAKHVKGVDRVSWLEILTSLSN